VRITLNYLAQQFKHFNRLCFDGKLVMPELQISHAHTTAGQVRYKVKRLPDGTKKKYDIKLCISDAYDYAEEQLQDIIIHEMIHYYIDANGLTDTSPHGEIFCTMMDDINARHGRHITISVQKTEEMRKRDLEEPRVSYVCLSTLNDDRKGVTVAASTRIHMLNRELPKLYRIKNMTWYFTTDPFFRRIPKSLTPKIYIVDPKLLTEHLARALEFEVTPTGLRQKKP